MSALDAARRQRFELDRIRAFVAEVEDVRRRMTSAARDLDDAAASLEHSHDEVELRLRLAVYGQEKRRLTDTVRAYRQFRRELEDTILEGCIAKGWIDSGIFPAFFDNLFDFDASRLDDGLVAFFDSEALHVPAWTEEGERMADERTAGLKCGDKGEP